MIPGEQTVYQGFLVPNAPADMYAAMGAKDQRIYVIPGKKMVIIRMGEASDPANPNLAVSERIVFSMFTFILNDNWWET